MFQSVSPFLTTYQVCGAFFALGTDTVAVAATAGFFAAAPVRAALAGCFLPVATTRAGAACPFFATVRDGEAAPACFVAAARTGAWTAWAAFCFFVAVSTGTPLRRVSRLPAADTTVLTGVSSPAAGDLAAVASTVMASGAGRSRWRVMRCPFLILPWCVMLFHCMRSRTDTWYWVAIRDRLSPALISCSTVARFLAASFFARVPGCSSFLRANRVVAVAGILRRSPCCSLELRRLLALSRVVVLMW